MEREDEGIYEGTADTRKENDKRQTRQCAGVSDVAVKYGIDYETQARARRRRKADELQK